MNLKGPTCLLIVVLAVATAPPGRAHDWLTLPSSFTHDPATGCRVNQFAKVDAPPINDQSQLITSGYSNYRSTIQFGQSADHYYRVNEWGPPVRPYGEWLFPYRPYSAPYGAWGAPFAGLNLGFGGPHFLGPPGQHDSGPRHWGGNHWGGNLPGGAYPGGHHPGHFPGGHSPGPVLPGGGIPGQPVHPYPVFPGGPYPEPPWYNGFHPDYPVRPRLSDEEFFSRP